MRRWTVFASALALWFAGGPAAGETFCVQTSAALTLALATAEGNGEQDEIRLRAGLYEAPDGGWHIDLLSGEFGVSLLGGYLDAECTQRSFDASLTVLDGRNLVRPLTIETSEGQAEPFPDSEVVVSALTFQNGSDAEIGALQISHPDQIYGGHVRVEGNRFIGNTVTQGFDGSLIAPALAAATDGPDWDGVAIVLRGNVFFDNTSQNAPAAFLFSNARIVLTNNTVAGNHATNTQILDRASLFFTTFTGLTLANNIFWDNNPDEAEGMADLNLDTGLVDLDSNAIQSYTGTPNSDVGTVQTEPGFVDAEAGDLRLAEESLLIDFGTNAPLEGLSEFDVAGSARVVGVRVDLGAYELAPAQVERIFVDGFELAPL